MGDNFASFEHMLWLNIFWINMLKMYSYKLTYGYVHTYVYIYTYMDIYLCVHIFTQHTYTYIYLYTPNLSSRFIKFAKGSFKRHHVGPMPPRAVLVTCSTPSQCQKATRVLKNWMWLLQSVSGASLYKRMFNWNTLWKLGRCFFLGTWKARPSINQNTFKTVAIFFQLVHLSQQGEAIRLLQGVLEPEEELGCHLGQPSVWRCWVCQLIIKHVNVIW